MSFIAAFDSDCENCDAPVEQGQEARMLDRNKGLVVHVECPPATGPRRTETLCARCWTTHAGECM